MGLEDSCKSRRDAVKKMVEPSTGEKKNLEILIFYALDKQ